MSNSLPPASSLPLVTVACICHNQAKFVEDALFSVINQTYPNIELIIIDDASSDHSIEVIKSFIQHYPHVQFLVNTKNLGNCRSFNKVLALAKGKYMIDLAADDVLLDTRVEKQVNIFETLDQNYGVIFTNALFIDEQSQPVSYHYPVDAKGYAIKSVPTGDVYTAVLKNYFICTPTMMIRKSMLDELGGYDEALSFEDFDFWVRSARKYRYYYLDEVLTLKRQVKGSLSSRFYQLRQNQLLHSTLIVCEKAMALNKNEAENQALGICIRYHLRQSFFTHNFELAEKYAQLLEKVDKPDFATQVILKLSNYRIRTWGLYQVYLRLLQKLKRVYNY